MAGRNPYTQKDVDCLAQYIAKYNPQQENRSGNALYKRLVEDADKKWAFSKRHPWQSWRDYYLSNRPQMDKKIARYIKEQSKQRQPLVSPASAASQSLPPVTQRAIRKRVDFSSEDDDNLVQWLAMQRQSSRSPLGTKLYELLTDVETYPWAERHPSQSWRERYRKNEMYFSLAIDNYLSGYEDYMDVCGAKKPKTVEDVRTHRRTSQTKGKSVASPEKRNHVCEGDGEAPPKKKARIQISDDEDDEQPVAGPSRTQALNTRHDNATSSGRPVPRQNVQQAGHDGEDIVRDVDDDRTVRDESDDDNQSEEEDLGPPGSDDYHGEIFDSPARAGEHDSESDQEREVLDNLEPDVQDEDFMVEDIVESRPEIGGDNDEHEEMPAHMGGAVASADHTADDQTVLSGSPPMGASPPAARHNACIQHNLDPDPNTSTFSPTEDANARHHCEHDNSPVPARKLVKRIRLEDDDDFFGTPKSKSDEEYGDPPPRAPPRLDDGAWNKAFSDARGKSRIDGAGKSRRRSGINSDDAAEVIGTQDTTGHDSDEDAPAQLTLLTWPPIRSKSKPPAQATSSSKRAATDKGENGETPGRMVTTEETVSVQTVRTVQRKMSQKSIGTPLPRANGALVHNTADLPSQSNGKTTVDAEYSQHHPFSQSKKSSSVGGGSTSSSTSLFPRVNGGSNGRAPLLKAQMEILQKMLEASRAPDEAFPSKFERDVKPPSPASQPEEDPFTTSQSQPNASLPKTTISPVGATRNDVRERYAKFAEEAEELSLPQSSPLADKKDTARRGIDGTSDEIVPQLSTAEATLDGPHSLSDKGKGRADPPPGVVKGSSRHTVACSGIHSVSDGPKTRTSIPVKQSVVLESLPNTFAIGRGGPCRHRPALGLSSSFNQSPSGSGVSRFYTSSPQTSRTMSPSDTSLVDSLPPNELHMVKEIGIQTVLARMVHNHGFNEETVRQVCAEARSLQAADYVLGEMRDGANERGNETLQSLPASEKNDDSDQDEAEDEDQTGPLQGHVSDEEEEVEDTLVQDSWLDGVGPLAESSRIVPLPRRQPLRIEPLPHVPSMSSEGEYSPPRRTRAAQYVKHAQRKVELAQGERDAMDADQTPRSTTADQNLDDFTFGQLSSYTLAQWEQLDKKYGPNAGKIAVGKALAKLLTVVNAQDS